VTPPKPEQSIDPRICEIKVVLQWISPEIWRRFQVPGDFTLAGLHYLLQNVMGWDGGDYHAHVFWTPERKYGVPAGLYTELATTIPSGLTSTPSTNGCSGAGAWTRNDWLRRGGYMLGDAV